MTANYLYVDPDGLGKISGPYEDAAENFIRLSGYLSELRGRYANAWGNDDLGQKVSPQVQEALRTLQDQVDALGKALGMYGDGLRTTSHAYRDADENADDAATQFRARTERIAVDMPPAVSGEATEEPRVFLRSTTKAERLGERVEGELLPGQMVEGQRVEGTLLQPRRRAMRALQPGEEGFGEPPTAELEPRQYRRATEFSALEPTQPGQLVRGRRVRGELIEPLQPAQYMPAQRVEGELLEPLQPARYLPAERIPVEPVEPVTEA